MVFLLKFSTLCWTFASEEASNLDKATGGKVVSETDVIAAAETKWSTVLHMMIFQFTVMQSACIRTYIFLNGFTVSSS